MLRRQGKNRISPRVQGVFAKADPSKEVKRRNEMEISYQNIIKKTRDFFKKIETQEEALTAIKEASIAFYFLGGLQIILGFFVNKLAIVDGTFYIISAFLLSKLKSRIVASLLFCLAAFASIMTAISFVAQTGYGRNIFLIPIILGMSIRAVQSTFTFQKMRRYKVVGKRLLLASIIVFIIGLLGSFVTFVTLGVVFGEEEVFNMLEKGTDNTAIGLFGIFVLLSLLGLLLFTLTLLIAMLKWVIKKLKGETT